MTTTIHIAVTGNKNVSVEIEPDGLSHIIRPNTHAAVILSGEQILTVKETGDFLDNSVYGTAKRAWEAYVEKVGGLSFEGKALPTWEELGKTQKEGWMAAALAV